jgi:hypothetical protein
MKRSMCVAFVMVAASCAVPDLESSEVEQALINCAANPSAYSCTDDCDGCGGNGLTIASWGDAFAALDKQTLKDGGLWPGEGPLSLCGSSGSGYCNMRPLWASWIGAVHPARRTNIMTDIVKCVATKGYRVIAPDGTPYWGEFGLRPETLGQVWDYRSRDTVSACLLIQLNRTPGVPICVLNEQTPGNCTTAAAGDPAPFYESAAIGNLFDGHYAAIIGGAHAQNPDLNQRYGLVDQPSEDPAKEIPYQVGTVQSCVHNTTVNTEGRHATACKDTNGAWWDYPVTARTPEAPIKWFFDKPYPLPPKTGYWPPLLEP